MRFERIFEDLEGQFVHQEQQEIRAVSEDLTRAERAQVTLADRLRGAQGRPVSVRVSPEVSASGVLREVGAGWIELQGVGATRVLMPMARIAQVEGLTVRARPQDEGVAVQSLGSLLRTVARDRSVVHMETTVGRLTGRLAAVGADALDLLTLPTGEMTPGPGSGRVTVVLDSVLILEVP